MWNILTCVLALLSSGCARVAVPTDPCRQPKPPAASASTIADEIPEPQSVWYQTEHAGHVWNIGFGSAIQIVDPRLRVSQRRLVFWFGGTIQIATDLGGGIYRHCCTSRVGYDFDGPPVSRHGYTVTYILGDVDGDGFVTEADVELVRERNGAPVTRATWRYDVNMDGKINLIDMAVVRSALSPDK